MTKPSCFWPEGLELAPKLISLSVVRCNINLPFWPRALRAAASVIACFGLVLTAGVAQAQQSAAPPPAAELPSASAPTDQQIQRCVGAYEEAQLNRNAGKLVEAEASLGICILDVCPEFVRADCGSWLSEVKTQMPTVIIEAVGSVGEALVDVAVDIDGVRALKEINGKPLALNPGKHTVVALHADKRVEVQLVVRQGEKNRVLTLQIATEQESAQEVDLRLADACSGEPGASAEGCPQQIGQERGTLTYLAYTSWGLGLVGAGLSIFNAVQVGPAEDAARRTEACNLNPERFQSDPCSGMSTDELNEVFLDQRDEANRALTIAVVAGSVGVALLTVGTGLYLADDPGSGNSVASMRVGLLPMERGAMMSLSGTF